MRTRKEWYDFCIKRGTSGDQVFDILRDWKEWEAGRPEGDESICRMGTEFYGGTETEDRR